MSDYVTFDFAVAQSTEKTTAFEHPPQWIISNKAHTSQVGVRQDYHPAEF